MTEGAGVDESKGMMASFTGDPLPEYEPLLGRQSD